MPVPRRVELAVYGSAKSSRPYDIEIRRSRNVRIEDQAVAVGKDRAASRKVGHPPRDTWRRASTPPSGDPPMRVLRKHVAQWE